MQDIWTNIILNDSDEITALTMLSSQKQAIKEKSAGELTIEIETIDYHEYDKPMKNLTLYILYVMAPKVGNYRKRILTVVEDKNKDRFPVDIISHIDETTKKDVTQDKFLESVTEIISCKVVSRTIQDLYIQSIYCSK